MNNEQPSTHYLLFVICSDENCFAASRRQIFPFSFIKNCLTDETATKRLRRKIDSPKRRTTVYNTIRVSPTFRHFVGVLLLFVNSVSGLMKKMKTTAKIRAKIKNKNVICHQVIVLKWQNYYTDQVSRI